MANATASLSNACGTASARKGTHPGDQQQRDAAVTGGTWLVSHT